MRQLSDEDVAAIAEALVGHLTDKCYRDLGKGFWGGLSSLFWKAVIGSILFVAAYGALKFGGKP